MIAVQRRLVSRTVRAEWASAPVVYGRILPSPTTVHQPFAMFSTPTEIHYLLPSVHAFFSLHPFPNPFPVVAHFHCSCPTTYHPAFEPAVIHVPLAAFHLHLSPRFHCPHHPKPFAPLPLHSRLHTVRIPPSHLHRPSTFSSHVHPFSFSSIFPLSSPSLHPHIIITCLTSRHVSASAHRPALPSDIRRRQCLPSPSAPVKHPTLSIVVLSRSFPSSDWPPSFSASSPPPPVKGKAHERSRSMPHPSERERGHPRDAGGSGGMGAAQRRAAKQGQRNASTRRPKLANVEDIRRIGVKASRRSRSPSRTPPEGPRTPSRSPPPDAASDPEAEVNPPPPNGALRAVRGSRAPPPSQPPPSPPLRGERVSRPPYRVPRWKIQRVADASSSDSDLESALAAHWAPPSNGAASQARLRSNP